MNAIVVDLKDFNVRTPEQVVRVFYMLYDATAVKEQLFEIFSAYADYSEPKDANKMWQTPDPAAVATLFDHLIALTDALQQLQKSTAGKCVICGRGAASDRLTTG
jgi:hypothetical protein